MSISGASLFFLDALSAKSIIMRDVQGLYHLHVLLRQHLFQKLSLIPGEPANSQASHCQYYTDIVHKAFGSKNPGTEKTASELIATDISNIRSAWEWASENCHLDELNNSIMGLFRYYEMKGQYKTGLEFFLHAGQRLERHCIQEPLYKLNKLIGKINALSGRFYCLLGCYEDGIAKLEQSVAIFKQNNDGVETALAQFELSELARAYGDYPRAMHLLEECLTYYTRVNDLLHIGDTLNSLGLVFSAMGNIIKSKHLYAESLSIFKALGDHRKIATVLNNIGNLAVENNQLPEAKQMFEESLAMSKQVDTNELRASILNSLGNISRSSTNYAKSEIFLKEALQLRLNMNSTPLVLESLVGIADLWACQGKNQQAYELLLEVREHPATPHAVRIKALETLEILGQQITSLPGPTKTENIENTVRAILYNT